MEYARVQGLKAAQAVGYGEEMLGYIRDERTCWDGIIQKGLSIDRHKAIEALAILAKDEDVDVRRGVAWNRNTPAETLTLLAKDEDVDVRYRVAMNPNTHTKTLILLAKDEHWYVRYGVARHPNTPDEVKKSIKL